VVVGHGVDLVEIERIRRSIDAHGDRFLTRVFTDGERADAGRGRSRTERLAARFAAKEAALKAIGTGWSRGVAWTDVETRTEPSGRPVLGVSGRAGEIAREMGGSRWSVSLSHAGGLAIASVILERA